jgi:hypothetical protein
VQLAEEQRFWQRVPLKSGGQVQVDELMPSLQEPRLKQGLMLQSLMLVAQLAPVNPTGQRHWLLISCKLPLQMQLFMDVAGVDVLRVPTGQAVQLALPAALLKVLGGQATQDIVV